MSKSLKYGSTKTSIRLGSPTSFAFNENGNIIVLDRDSDRVKVFASDGRWLFNFGGPGKRVGEFDFPYAVDAGIKRNGKIAITDARNGRVQVFDETGHFLFSFGEGHLTKPTTIRYSWKLDTYVIFDPGELAFDRDREYLFIFDGNGRFLRKFRQHSPGSLFDCLTREGHLVCSDFKQYFVMDQCGNLTQNESIDDISGIDPWGNIFMDAIEMGRVIPPNVFDLVDVSWDARYSSLVSDPFPPGEYPPYHVTIASADEGHFVPSPHLRTMSEDGCAVIYSPEGHFFKMEPLVPVGDLLFCQTVLLCDKSLHLTATNEEASPEEVQTRSFFKILVRLPMELQMMICNRVSYDPQDIIPSDRVECTLRHLERKMNTSFTQKET